MQSSAFKIVRIGILLCFDFVLFLDAIFSALTLFGVFSLSPGSFRLNFSQWIHRTEIFYKSIEENFR